MILIVSPSWGDSPVSPVREVSRRPADRDGEAVSLPAMRPWLTWRSCFPFGGKTLIGLMLADWASHASGAVQVQGGGTGT